MYYTQLDPQNEQNTDINDLRRKETLRIVHSFTLQMCFDRLERRWLAQ